MSQVENPGHKFRFSSSAMYSRRCATDGWSWKRAAKSGSCTGNERLSFCSFTSALESCAPRDRSRVANASAANSQRRVTATSRKPIACVIPRDSYRDCEPTAHAVLIIKVTRSSNLVIRSEDKLEYNEEAD